MYETVCIFCGEKMNWSADFNYGDAYPVLDEEDEGRIITQMTCPKCGAIASFVEPHSE